MPPKARIAHLAGSNATIQNSPPLVTSNKARAKYGLPPLTDADGNALRFDVLRPQRLAAPVTVYVEQFSAHPLESDAAELYGPPDGYVDRAGGFHRERQNESDVPVYEITLSPDDGLYPLPYMAVQADGSPWDEDCAAPNAPASPARQPFYPDGARLLEEIDRLGIDGKGLASVISSRADVDFYRVTPPGGYTKGEPPEVPGEHFFPYRPKHLAASPPRPALATITNSVQRILASGSYAGAIWTQGSPRIEETVYWLNLLIDTTLPICGNASQRPHGMISNDGDKNLADSTEFIVSRVWADESGNNRVGVVLIQDQDDTDAVVARLVSPDARDDEFGRVRQVLVAIVADHAVRPLGSVAADRQRRVDEQIEPVHRFFDPRAALRPDGTGVAAACEDALHGIGDRRQRRARRRGGEVLGAVGEKVLARHFRRLALRIAPGRRHPVEVDVGAGRDDARQPLSIDAQPIDLLEQARAIRIERLPRGGRRGVRRGAVLVPRASVGLHGHVRQGIEAVIRTECDFVYRHIGFILPLAMKTACAIHVAVRRPV